MKKNHLGNRLFMALVFLFLYAPILVLIVFSFNSARSASVWGGFSVHWYAELFRNRRIMTALRTTLLVSALASVISCVAGTAASIGIQALRRKARGVVLTVNNIPLTNADIITGVSMSLLFTLAIGAFNGSISPWLYETFHLSFKWSKGFVTMLIAHITFDIPYVILSVMPKLRQLDPNLYEAAQDLGATPMTAFRKVVLPDLMPGIVNGLLMAFTMSIDDFVISYFTAGSRTYTLAMEIYAMARRKISPEINAMSTLLFVSVLLLLVIINLREAAQNRRRQRMMAALDR